MATLPLNIRPEPDLDSSCVATVTRDLFARIERSTDLDEQAALRQEVARINLGVATSMASRYRGRGELDDDLRQAACVGLVKAVNGYDSSRGADFLPYAVVTISGELKKHFRDHCWTIKPPRRIQELQPKIAAAYNELAQTTGRPATVIDIATALDEDAATVTEAMTSSGCFSPNSLDAPLRAQEQTTVGDTLADHDAGFSRVEARAMLEPLLQELTARERLIIVLRFYRDCTQSQIADLVGVTQMQVSRLLTRILADMRLRLI